MNRVGAFNVPIGRYTAPPICDVPRLRSAVAVLARAELRCADYRVTVADARRGDFVYFDPPYDGAFVTYTQRGFDAAAQTELSFTVRTLAARGA